MDSSQLFMLLGFLVASYAIVANDTIQTLGTFLSSNSKKPWWVLWLFAGSILSAVLIYGWYINGGDVSYGRLSKIPLPEQFYWWHVLPPVALLFLTRSGIPVSTTFLVLSVFSSSFILGKILLKSLIGYGVAFVAAIVLWALCSKFLEKRFAKKDTISKKWIVGQWFTTGFLWSQWLIQDFANIYVFLPRKLEPLELAASLFVLLSLLALIFSQKGGKIQRIVTTKYNTHDIRSATVIDFMYGAILYYFKGLNNLPMSTTWVFLGILAGREFALSHRLKLGSFGKPFRAAGMDLGKALTGLAVSLIIAFGLRGILDKDSGNAQKKELPNTPKIELVSKNLKDKPKSQN